jgi:RNA polymerase sigma-70 factor (ECF subfamily)
MNEVSTDTAPWLGSSARFATTCWTVLFRAAEEGPDQRGAMQAFCQAYWYPVYAFIRRRGSPPEAARDLTQEFFARLIEKDWLAGIERRETRFSTLLLTILKRFLVNEHQHDHAAKRGGGAVLLSIDAAQGEEWFGAEPATSESPDKLFERRWALSILSAALDRLKAELAKAGKVRHLELLSPFLSAEPQPGEYESVGAALDLSGRTVAVTVHRLRQRFREIVREELAAGSPDRHRVDEEMRDLVRSLGA